MVENKRAIGPTSEAVPKHSTHFKSETDLTTPKEPVLFQGTIFQNVEYGLAATEMANLGMDEKEKLVVEACKAAFAHDFIDKLPEVRRRGANLCVRHHLADCGVYRATTPG